MTWNQFLEPMPENTTTEEQHLTYHVHRKTTMQAAIGLSFLLELSLNFKHSKEILEANSLGKTSREHRGSPKSLKSDIITQGLQERVEVSYWSKETLVRVDQPCLLRPAATIQRPENLSLKMRGCL